jgi:hypothetical protein
LWECSETVTGVWRRGGGLEFLKFSFGEPERYRVLAHSEQGFWTTVFDFLYEGNTTLEVLRAAAAVVGFRFLDRLLLAREQTELGTFEAHR